MLKRNWEASIDSKEETIINQTQLDFNNESTPIVDEAHMEQICEAAKQYRLNNKRKQVFKTRKRTIELRQITTDLHNSSNNNNDNNNKINSVASTIIMTKSRICYEIWKEQLLRRKKLADEKKLAENLLLVS